MSIRGHFCAAACAALVALPLAAQTPEPPNARRQKELVEELLSLDALAPEQRARQLEIVAELERVPPLRESAERAWRKRIASLRKDLPTIGKKPGTYHLWDDGESPPRGKYIVGGETKKPSALFIGLHGGGVGSGEAEGSAGQYDGACRELGWVGIFPEVLEKTELGWTTSGTEEFVLELTDRVRRTWGIDADRVYLGGHSMGGYGTWALGGRHPDRWAGLAPSAGGPSPVFGAGDVVVGIMQGVIPNLRNVRMVVFQSDDDPRVPPGPNRYAAKEVERARRRWGGFDFDYWEVTGRGHAAPEGGSVVHLRKIAEHARDPRPSFLVWEPEHDWKRRFYWLSWERPERHVLVEAEVDGDRNVIDVRTEARREGFTVWVDDGLVDLRKPVVVRFEGETVYSGRPQPTLAALALSACWDDDRYLCSRRIVLDP